jgi:hypothetical protein
MLLQNGRKPSPAVHFGAWRMPTESGGTDIVSYARLVSLAVVALLAVAPVALVHTAETASESQIQVRLQQTLNEAARSLGFQKKAEITMDDAALAAFDELMIRGAQRLVTDGASEDAIRKAQGNLKKIFAAAARNGVSAGDESLDGLPQPGRWDRSRPVSARTLFIHGSSVRMALSRCPIYPFC